MALDWLLSMADPCGWDCCERFWRWIRDDPEYDEASQRAEYVAPLPTTTVKSPAQRDATRRKMRERVAERRRRDAS